MELHWNNEDCRTACTTAAFGLDKKSVFGNNACHGDSLVAIDHLTNNVLNLVVSKHTPCTMGMLLYALSNSMLYR